MYLGYFNFLMIAFVFLNSIKNESVRNFLDENHFITYPLIVIVFLIFSFILGRLDTKLGLRKEELRNLTAENPIMMEILNSLEEIKGKTLPDKKTEWQLTIQNAVKKHKTG